MKFPYLLLYTIHLSLFSTPSVSGQNKPCNNFACAYLKAENFLKQAAYQKALDNLDSAEGYLTDTNTKEKEQIKQLRRQLFVAIEKDRDAAIEAKKLADYNINKVKGMKNQIEQAKHYLSMATDSLTKNSDKNSVLQMIKYAESFLNDAQIALNNIEGLDPSLPIKTVHKSIIQAIEEAQNAAKNTRLEIQKKDINNKNNKNRKTNDNQNK